MPLKASLSPLVITSSVFLVRKLKALSFPLSSLIIFSILKLVGITRGPFVGGARVWKWKNTRYSRFLIYWLVTRHKNLSHSSKIHLSIRKPVNTPYTGMFHLCHEIWPFSACVNYNLHVSLVEFFTDLIALIENAIIIKYF